MGMIRRWHSNSFSGKMTEIYICRAYPSRITRNWLVFRYQEIEFRLHPRVESRDDLFGNQTRPSNTRFPYPKAHLPPPICLAAVFVSFPSFPPLAKIPRRNLDFPYFAVGQLPPMTTGHPIVDTRRCLTSVKSLSYRGQKIRKRKRVRDERGAFNTLVRVEPRINREEQRRGDHWSVPRDTDRRDSTMRHAQASLFADPTGRFYNPKYRETSPVAVVLDTPQQLITVNWRSSIFELTPFESKGFLSWGKGRGEAASFATTWGHGRKTIRVGERPTRGPCQSSFSRNGKRWLRKKKKERKKGTSGQSIPWFPGETSTGDRNDGSCIWIH